MKLQQNKPEITIYRLCRVYLWWDSLHRWLSWSSRRSPYHHQHYLRNFRKFFFLLKFFSLTFFLQGTNHSNLESMQELATWTSFVICSLLTNSPSVVISGWTYFAVPSCLGLESSSQLANDWREDLKKVVIFFIVTTWKECSKTFEASSWKSNFHNQSHKYIK